MWSCRAPNGCFVDGHRSSSGEADDRCYDSWDHVQGFGAHVAMVCEHPWSGLLQGAEGYLRHLVRRPGVDSEVAQRVQDALDLWDTQQHNHGTGSHPERATMGDETACQLYQKSDTSFGSDLDAGGCFAAIEVATFASATASSLPTRHRSLPSTSRPHVAGLSR